MKQNQNSENISITNSVQVDNISVNNEEGSFELKMQGSLIVGLLFVAFFIPYIVGGFLSSRFPGSVLTLKISGMMWIIYFLISLPFYLSLITIKGNLLKRFGIFLLLAIPSYTFFFIASGALMIGFVSPLIIPFLLLGLLFLITIIHMCGKNIKFVAIGSFFIYASILIWPIILIMFFGKIILKDISPLLIPSLLTFAFIYFYKNLEKKEDYNKTVTPFFITIIACTCLWVWSRIII